LIVVVGHYYSQNSTDKHVVVTLVSVLWKIKQQKKKFEYFDNKYYNWLYYLDSCIICIDSQQFNFLSKFIIILSLLDSYSEMFATFFSSTGYGDIHAVNLREMIFIMIYVSFDMVLGAYLIGNMTALIVKGSKTEKFRDRMTDLMKYMNRNKLHRDIREQIKGHVRLQFESSYTDAAVLQDIPISIRSKVIRERRGP